ncbi:MAG TPA: hypothetical protein VKQ08_02885, partial [Cyclobacteriaceae bacterium]|nr:hypothetical protein [Cyclobacteriaceae bacterium]
MRTIVIRAFLIVLSWLFCSMRVNAQQDSLNSLVQKFDHYQIQNIQEKIFVHIDHTFFVTGETLWFSVFVVDGFLHRPSDLSKVVYLEVIDKDKVSVLKVKISVTDGMGNGALFIPSSLSSGNYALIAYTRWMQNFSPDCYFNQPITVVNPFVRLAPQARGEQRPYDIQFFPEGGNLVEGLPSTVAFRAVGRNGIGVDFLGAVLNARNDTVLHTRPLKFGLGKFRFTPEAGQHYTLVFTDPDNRKITTPIPVAMERGYVIQVKDSLDFLEVNVYSRFQDGFSKSRWVYLFVQSLQIRIAARVLPLSSSRATFRIEKKKLREGVNHFTLLDDNLKPVCERLYFKKPEHSLRLEVKPDLEKYSTREKIELNFVSRVSDGRPANPAMSVSVYRMDSLEQDEPLSISNFLWLTSELKGKIESPGYYL